MKVGDHRRVSVVRVEPTSLDAAEHHAPPSDADPHPLPPLPSGASLAKQTATSGSTTRPWETRLRGAAVGAPDLKAGAAALEARLGEIERLASQGVRVRCVFDLDNTLFDTRWRTLYCARELDRRGGTDHFTALSDDELIGHIRNTGRETGIALGLPDDVVEELGALWDTLFWHPDSLVHDRPMDPPLSLIARCRDAGAEVVFLTGRVERFEDTDGRAFGFREASLAQLAAAGIVDVAPEQLLLKPGVDTRTGPFKADALRRFEAEGAIGFFLTEGVRDTLQVREALPDATCFLLQCSFEDLARRPSGVPVLAGRW